MSTGLAEVRTWHTKREMHEEEEKFLGFKLDVHHNPALSGIAPCS